MSINLIMITAPAQAYLADLLKKQDTDSLDPPDTWQDTRPDVAEVYEVPEGDEKQMVMCCFLDSLDAASRRRVVVSKIKRIQNLFLWRLYKNYRSNLLLRDGIGRVREQQQPLREHDYERM